MIEIKHLKKTYISKDKSKSRGLVDVSFTLPSSGFVFVLGKSGSGKSTLLNRLGTLDEPTSGEILVDGKDISCFTDEERSYYRSSYCGFVFQDYQLINELTVRENVMLSLDIVSDTKDKKERADRALKEMGLFDYGDKYPNELSGGQKQRVSIARALVKNPKLVLCDEPTGNLDKRTSKAILDRLKERSKTCLVFMVSHDPEASLAYADRRIRLQDGLVINDERRKEGYVNEWKTCGDTLFLPYKKSIDQEQEQQIDDILSKGNIHHIRQLDSGFEKTKEIPSDKEVFSSKNNSFDKKAKRTITWRFTKKGKLGSFRNAALFALLFVIFVVFQTFVSFDSSRVRSSNLSSDRNDVVFSKVQENTDNFGSYVDISEETEEKVFYGNDVKHYPIVSYSITTEQGSTSGLIDCGFKLQNDAKLLNHHGFYSNGTQGTAIVDRDYLKKRFGDKDGNVEVLAGSLENCKSEFNLIITDYIADARIDSYYEGPYKDYNYEDLIGPVAGYSTVKYKFRSQATQCICKIGCVIKTNYKEKYSLLLRAYDEIKNQDFNPVRLARLQQRKEYETYFNDIVNGELTLGYTLNPDFYSQRKDGENSDRTIIYLSGIFFSPGEVPGQYDQQGATTWSSYGGYESALKDDEVVLPASYRALLFVALGNQEPVGKEIHLYKTDNGERDGKITGDIKLKIKRFSQNGAFAFNYKTGKRVNAMQTKVLGYLVPINEPGFADSLSYATQEGLTIWDKDNSIYSRIRKTLLLFTELFEFVEIALAVIRMILLVVIGRDNIKKNKYQIGVRKSLGRKDRDIRKIFRTKNILFEFVSIFFGIVALPGFYAFSNRVVEKAYSAELKIAVKNLKVFYFHPVLLAIDVLFLILYFILVAWIPLLTLKKITPAKIVNNKDE
mgnify:FL=1